LDLQGASEGDYSDLAGSVKETFGRLDGLLHNAALMGTRTPFELYNAELWYRVFQVNVHAAFMLTRACLPLLKRSEHGRIVFTSAEVGRHGQAYWGAYAASKAALENIVETLAAELQDTAICVNSLDPGAVRTAMRTSAFPGEDPEELPRPDEVMGMYLYALGPDSQGTTGKRLNAQPD
jgi:NAD(P)-dependent dehydrogenase (short-subunit alcohol dehydrogenase family)